MASKRIVQEHENLQRDPLETYSVGPAETGDSRWWIGHITRPPDTPYERRSLSFAIVFPEDYPMKPFQFTFTTPLSHPNVSEKGEVRLPELEEKNWSPILTVCSILICLQALLSTPNPSKKATNSEAARMSSMNNRAERDTGSDAAAKCVEPTHRGKRIGDKKYAMDMSRPEFEEYKNLIGVDEQNRFLIDHADMIRDVL